MFTYQQTQWLFVAMDGRKRGRLSHFCNPLIYKHTIQNLYKKTKHTGSSTRQCHRLNNLHCLFKESLRMDQNKPKDNKMPFAMKSIRQLKLAKVDANSVAN